MSGCDRKSIKRCVISSPSDRSSNAKVRIPHRSTVDPPPPPPPDPVPAADNDIVVDVDVDPVTGDLSTFFSVEEAAWEEEEEDEEDPDSPCPLCRNHAEDSGA